MNSKQTLRLFALLLICLAFSLAPQKARAQGLHIKTYEVNTFEDLYDPAPNDDCAGWIGPGPTDFGPCSLRAALTEAGYTYPTDHTPALAHIKLPPGVYKLTLDTPSVEDLYYGDLDLPEIEPGKTPHEVLIEGTGGPGNPSIIDANFIDRALEIGRGRTLTLKNLIIKNGLINADDNDAALGGGIIVREGSFLSLENVRLTNHTVRCNSGSVCTDTSGGAIYSENANLSLLNVELDHNSADYGSAIFFWDSTLSANEYQISINRSAIHHNSSQKSAINGRGDSLLMSNSTMAANQSLSFAMADNINFAGTVWIQNSTLISASPSSNVAVSGVGNLLNIRNSILMSSLDPPPDSYRNCNCLDDIVSRGGNIFSDDSCNPVPALHDAVLSYPQARLGPLANYSGPSPTIGLLPGSPVIDHFPGKCMITTWLLGEEIDRPLYTDQRGEPRNDGRCDPGAFEGIINFNLHLPLIRK